MHSFIFTLIFSTIVFGPPPPTPAPTPTPPPPPPPAPGGKPWTTAELRRVDRRLASDLRAPTLRGAQIGLIARDTQRGTTIYSENARQEFQPASNFKLLVGSTVLRDLGLNFAFTTKVTAEGGITDGRLPNLYLVGGGDAHLTEHDLDAAAAALAAAGLRHVDGDVIADASRYDDQRYGYGWSWDDLPYYYAPVVTALELDEGTVNLTIAPGPAVGAPAVLRVWPQSSAYTIDDELTTGPAGSKDTSNIAREWSQPLAVELYGNYPADGKVSGDVVPSVPDPQQYAGDVFARALAAHGITIGGSVHSGASPAGATVLWSHSSDLLPTLMQQFWYPSDNLMGELFLKELGAVEGGTPGTDAKGEIPEERFLRSIGVDPSTVTIADGSGLSSYDRITPFDLLSILQADWESPYRSVVLDALPVSGVRGTLRHDFLGTPAEKVVFAKTGSINHVRTISGFVQTRTHGPVTFSFLVNQWMGEGTAGGAAALNRVRGAVLSELATQ
jgi:D-alanyl-D-alanine carboxypeptidase/D-alanyl-D-alanine-endopeptidase (penicillin-binding protein 4)